MATTTRRSWLVPEQVQTSAMDCGPAALSAMLRGYRLPNNYDRLREACQTSVDGTSIDTIEEVAVQLGLHAEQVVIPADHLLLQQAAALPAIVVVMRPTSGTHFIVVWRKHGAWVQVMDPARGRRWISQRELAAELYRHEMNVGTEEWREWAGTDEFIAPLHARLTQLGLPTKECDELLTKASADSSWRGLAVLDGAARLVKRLRGEHLRDEEAAPTLTALFELACGLDDPSRIIPRQYFSVLPAGADELRMRGAVLIRVRGVQQGTAEAALPLQDEQLSAISVQLPGTTTMLLRLVRGAGWLAPMLAVLALVVAAGTALIEVLVFRGLLSVSQQLDLVEQRLGAVALVLLLLGGTLLLELPIWAIVLRLGRQLEARLRLALARALPRMADDYFATRLTSDMAERGHSIHYLRNLTSLGEQLLRNLFALLVTAGGLIWLDPAGGWQVLTATAIVLALPLVLQRAVAEQDLRVRTHLGALSGYYLDTLLGLVALRAHRAEGSVRSEHEALLVEWSLASRRQLSTRIWASTVVMASGLGAALWLFRGYQSRFGGAGELLLFGYWALAVPAFAQGVAAALLELPSQRNVAKRLFEPLATQQQQQPAGYAAPATPAPPAHCTEAARIDFDQVELQIGGHRVLSGLQLHIAPGEKVAVVGRSGAGKSSLLGLLLGWHRPKTGTLRVDQRPLHDEAVEQLRARTAWVDPAVRLWNRSLAENLSYGNDGALIGAAIDPVELRDVLDRLPAGMATALGEGGGMVSGGEGQRVRLGRAWLRDEARLVLLDEPFRGLDRTTRQRMLKRAMSHWSQATMLCVTHDISETLHFPRVLVLEDGQVVEDGAPVELASADTRYARMLAVEQTAYHKLWRQQGWRRLEIVRGRLRELAR